jgi:endonuclease/exonuclease/phosphatase family metal-dependent hydrolase
MKTKIISFNIRCTDDENGYSVKERAPRLAKIMETYDADVVGIQEYTPLWTEYIDEYFCDKYEFFNKYRTDKGWIEAAPILWKKDRYTCLKQGYFWLSDTPEVMSGGWDEYRHNRICMYALLRDKRDGKTFAFFNTHLGFGEENQIKSVRLIGQYMDMFAEYPMFITGDFNMIPSSAPYAEMVKKFKDVNGMTVNDRRSTYHGYDLHNNFDMHIDYCFINDKIAPISFKIIDEQIEGKFPSDHYGIYIELEI